ncbi:hypothetical protein HOY82DRAFT_383690 [Tuber indicum]|nr:hypothetical protein HOY82DRAFT_383690 [Tuber indicum]
MFSLVCGLLLGVLVLYGVSYYVERALTYQELCGACANISRDGHCRAAYIAERGLTCTYERCKNNKNSDHKEVMVLDCGRRESVFRHLSTSIYRSANRSHSGDRAGPSLLDSGYSSIAIKKPLVPGERSKYSFPLRGIRLTSPHLGPFLSVGCLWKACLDC